MPFVPTSRFPANDALEIRLESTEIDCEKVWVRQLDGREAISKLFEFDLVITSRAEHGLDVAAVAGAQVTIVFQKNGFVVRRVHGMVSSIVDRLETEAKVHVYQIRVVPRAYRLALIEMLDVQVDQSVPDVIKAKVGSVGLEDAIDLRLSGDYEPREFVVQYKEADLAFVTRLSEHLGMSFFFDQTETEDRIVFTDHESGFAQGEEHIPFRRRGNNLDVYRLELAVDVIPTTYVVQDYNYRTPLVDLSASHELADGFAGGVVEYGGHFKTPKAAQALALVRAEERKSLGKVYRGESDLSSFTAGLRIGIDGHPRVENGAMLLVAVTHHATQPEFDASSEERRYSNTFTAIPAGHTYRPQRVTPRPRIPGVVTGIIDAGPTPGSNEIARIDEHGRYFVRLLFDTAGGARRASHPIRMAQPHAGPGYGQHFPLKPGVEVIVVFVEGDPDRPVISGAVPNPLNPSPVVANEAPVNRIRTQSGIVIEMHDR